VQLQPTRQTGADLAERVKSILETRHLSLYQVSQRSEAIYGHGSPYSLSHNLYYELRLGTFSPSLYQLFALSRISDYRLADWISVFALDLEEIPCLQISLPTNRTIVLDSSAGDPTDWFPWFRNRSSNQDIPPVAPLSQLLELGPAVRQHLMHKTEKQDFLYAKIGCEDAFAFPDLVPGSIVRVSTGLADGVPGTGHISPDRIFLVEHRRGFCCCRLLSVGNNRILPVSAHLPYAQVELQVYREVRVLGAVDIEIRPMFRVQQPEVPKDLARRWKPLPLIDGKATLSGILREARAKTALSLRAASALSRQVATMLSDDRYFMSASSLSDYEARDTPPRHLQKVITMCLLYAVPFRTCLKSLDLQPEKAGQESIPAHLTTRMSPSGPRAVVTEPSPPDDGGFLGELLKQFQPIPFFLRGAVTDIFGLTSPSLHNFFWTGGVSRPVHRYLANALLVSVDRRKQKPVDSRSRPPWQQSLYVVLKRDGSYFCAPCGIENGALVIHPDAEHLTMREEFRNRRDAEVIGQVLAIVRRL
jgi:hypothetical protein